MISCPLISSSLSVSNALVISVLSMVRVGLWVVFGEIVRGRYWTVSVFDSIQVPSSLMIFPKGLSVLVVPLMILYAVSKGLVGSWFVSTLVSPSLSF